MIAEEKLLEALKNGVGRTRSLMADLTEYHGGPVETEYLLTSDLAREFLERGYLVSVEGLNRNFCSALSSDHPVKARWLLGAKRTDVVVGDVLAPDILIEVKIRVKGHSAISDDLRKICKTIGLMKASRQRTIIGASVFQFYLSSTRVRCTRDQFVSAVVDFETQLRSDLACSSGRYEDFSLELVSLMATPQDGIVDDEIDHDFDGTPMLGRKGHTTRYYAVLVKHRLYGQSSPTSFAKR